MEWLELEHSDTECWNFISALTNCNTVPAPNRFISKEDHFFFFCLGQENTQDRLNQMGMKEISPYRKPLLWKSDKRNQKKSGSWGHPCSNNWNKFEVSISLIFSLNWNHNRNIFAWIPRHSVQFLGFSTERKQLLLPYTTSTSLSVSSQSRLKLKDIPGCIQGITNQVRLKSMTCLY